MTETKHEKLARELSECVDVMPKTLKDVQKAVYNACLDALTTATQQAVVEERKLVDDVLDYDHWPNDKGKRFARLFLKSMIELSRSEALFQK